MQDTNLSIPQKLIDIAENIDYTRAFVCTPETFITIYKMEKRRDEREEYPRCMIHIHFAGDISRGKMRELEENFLEVAAQTLRAGDLLCRWQYSHIIMLLPNINTENTEKVLQRIKNNFLSNYELPKEISLETNACNIRAFNQI